MEFIYIIKSYSATAGCLNKIKLKYGSDLLNTQKKLWKRTKKRLLLPAVPYLKIEIKPF